VTGKVNLDGFCLFSLVGRGRIPVVERAERSVTGYRLPWRSLTMGATQDPVLSELLDAVVQLRRDVQDLRDGAADFLRRVVKLEQRTRGIRPRVARVEEKVGIVRPSPGMEGRKGRTSKSSSEKPDAEAETLFGFSRTTILHWMGANGWTPDQARAVFAAYGLEYKDIGTAVADGKNPKYARPAQLTPAQSAELTNMAGLVSGSGGSNKARVFRMWLADKNVSPAACSAAVGRAVLLSTIESWLRDWARRRNIPKR
jgi:hypothetical protein